MRINTAAFDSGANRSTDFISLGNVIREQLGMQSQYGSRYANRAFSTEAAKIAGHEYPYLADGLRISGIPDFYHSLTIHKDDAAEFVARVLAYRIGQGVWPLSDARVTDLLRSRVLALTHQVLAVAEA